MSLPVISDCSIFIVEVHGPRTYSVPGAVPVTPVLIHCQGREPFRSSHLAILIGPTGPQKSSLNAHSEVADKVGGRDMSQARYVAANQGVSTQLHGKYRY